MLLHHQDFSGRHQVPLFSDFSLAISPEKFVVCFGPPLKQVGRKLCR